MVWTTGADVRVGARRRLRSGSLPSDRWTHCPFRDPRPQLEATSRPDDPPWSRLVALVDRAIDPLSESAWRMLLEFWHASVHDPQLRAHGADLHHRYRRPFVEAIRSGIEHGDFQTDADEDIVAVLVGVLDGLIIPRVLEHDYFQPAGVRAVVLRALAATLNVPEPAPIVSAGGRPPEAGGIP